MLPELDTANKRIRALRQALQMTRQEFGDKTGIKVTTLENIEKAKQKVHDEHFQAIATIWPEYTYWLVTGEEPSIVQLHPALLAYMKRLQRMDESGIPDPVVRRIRKSILKAKKKLD